MFIRYGVLIDVAKSCGIISSNIETARDIQKRNSGSLVVRLEYDEDDKLTNINVVKKGKKK